ncbi:dynein assembly factor 3, axonemal [Aplysia californica]|uniref:Dynein assembly factor 3, axonemal n=1 Tax=Aplysia californica TaxID=6500 RepID=A0ABM0K7Q4_APLCA|nr:dynein assembly factor 3, axonemal [Aplysia californica]
MTDGYGNINFWGFSPALDLQQTGLAEMSSKLICSIPDELHILIVGAGDFRHVLMTVARRYRHSKKKLKFYVVESALELYARDILFTMIALEKQENMGLQDKTELFLELYGNALVREQSSQYVERMSHELIHMVTDFDYLEEKLPLFDLSALKYKERDFLEGIFKFWRNKEKQLFDISQCWDLRQRQLLGVRYDSKMNAFDWDYNMALIERGGSIVHLKQYKDWRSNGIAFQIREGTYDVPNRTVASGMVFKHEGERYPRRGYWGDMVVSPYIPFGVETEEKSFFKKQNNMHTKTAEDVSEFNVTALFHELMMKEKYELPKVEEKDGKVEDKSAPQTATLEEITEENEEEEAEEKSEVNKSESEENEDKNESAVPEEKSHEWLPLEDVKVIFLPVACTADLVKKAKYKKLFNVVFFSNSMVHHLKPEVSELFADKCSLILETALFMLQLKAEHVQEFVKKTTGLAEATGCKSLEACDDLQDSYIKFYYER